MNKRVKLFIPVAFFLAMLGLLFFGLGRDPNQVPSALINRPLPEFSLPSLDVEAPQITKADLMGGIFIVNVWATWCPPCHIEHPYLLEISKREKDISFVGVNYKDSVKEARQFLAEKGDPFKLNIVDSDGRFGIDLGVAGAPETFVVDANGTIRYRHVGVIDNRIWAETFAPLIAKIK
ncbi:MAG: DsbE family thiol:disulfide interchange protein [Pseudomonadales bacterium]|nr:DsbE family thiol:disulfide interchange protein [Pseudomonadales bacterium]